LKDKPERQWYLMPLLFGLLGGIFIYATWIRHDAEKANAAIWMGLAVSAIWAILGWIIFFQ
jgi:hypothetical protein